ncbi:MAG: ATP-grasp domain-containing protein [Firmicutes bacterium]|nr:ATP-grasp domain-containing protein [Bacillota bacterium]
MKKIMIIGGGINQIPLITAAKKEGYYTVVCDYSENACGVKLADKYCKVSTKNRDALYKVAYDNFVNGVIANSEYAMIDVAYISKKLGIIGNSVNSIMCLSSKNEFRRLQSENGLFAPKYGEYSDVKELCDNISNYNFPIIIKPSESSGTRGTLVIYNDEDELLIEETFRNCKIISRNSKVTVEEYVEMPSESVIEGEVFVHNGEFIWDGLFETVRSKSAPMIPMTYNFPLNLASDKKEKIRDTLKKAFNAAGITHGEYNIELYFTKEDNPFIIEINGRQGGNFLPQYVKKHTGIDFNKLLVTTVMGDDYYWHEIKNITCLNNCITHHMLYPRVSGIFDKLIIDDKVKPYIESIHLNVKNGERIYNTKDASSEIGYVDMSFSNIVEQGEITRRIEELIYIKVR